MPENNQQDSQEQNQNDTNASSGSDKEQQKKQDGSQQSGDNKTGDDKASDGKSGDDDKKDEKKEKKPMEPRKKRRFLVLGLLGGIIIIILLVLWLIHTSGYETTDDAQVDGHLDSIASRVNGTVMQVLVENNQIVKAGQLLVRLDPRDLQETAAKDKAQYDQAVAKLAVDFPNVPIQDITNAGTISQDQAQVNSAHAAYEGAGKDYESKVDQLHEAEAANDKAQKDLVRYRQLMEKREIAPSDYDQYLATARQDQATVDSDRHSAESSAKTIDEKKGQLDQNVSKMRQDAANAPQQAAMKRSQLDQDKASIAAAKAQYDADMLDVSYTEIYSPVDGVATQRNAELGSRVNAAQQVMVIVQTHDQWVTANFKETQLKKMHPGQHVNLGVDALGKTFSGTVEAMPAATGDRDSLFPPENATGNYVKVVQRLPVRIKFDPNQIGLDGVRPGMSVEVKVHF